MSSNMDQSMPTIDLDNHLGDGIGDPTPPSAPIVPNGMEAAHTSEEPITSMAPQSQDVGHMQPGPLNSQAAHSQLDSQEQYNDVTAQWVHNLPLFGYLKRKRVEQHQEEPYVKKPPNAFMIFMKEQRPKYAAKMTTGGTAEVNVILGQKWKSLSKDEQAKYCEQAYGEKLHHAQCHPDWTHADNYGVKRKRDRSQAARLAAKLAEASTSGEVSQPAMGLCVASVVVEAPPTNTHGTES